MENYKGTGELSDELAVFEQEAADSIAAELRRIGRAVNADELSHIPFLIEVQPYIEAIRLDGAGNPVFDTSFSDVDEKTLSAFISDGEIGAWDLIALLGMLQDIV